MQHVPFSQRHVARWLDWLPGLGPALARVESGILRDEIDSMQPGAPIWICGMARAGSTILLEALNSAPPFTAHQYGDYPWLWTPYWRNWLRARLPKAQSDLRERAHGDRLAVGPESPEAFEETFWMHAFADRHDPAADQRLDPGQRNDSFDRAFDDHQRKLLLIRGAQRYLAKANYQLPRIDYLLRRYPDARFVIPVREPFAQIESLRRQDQRFCQLAREDPAVSAHLARVGHFEFGPQKRAYHLGNDALTADITEHYANGNTIGGYARQWLAQYGYALARTRSDPTFAKSCLWVGYERLCADAETELARIARHVGLNTSDSNQLVAKWQAGITAPTHPPIDWTADQCADVDTITSDTWEEIQPLLDAG